MGVFRIKWEHTGNRVHFIFLSYSVEVPWSNSANSFRRSLEFRWDTRKRNYGCDRRHVEFSLDSAQARIH